MITTRTYSFESVDGVTIHGVCMIPENPVAILQMVHGMNEHKDRYTSFMQAMAERGYIVFMQDNRGHGQSVNTPDDIGYCYKSMEKGYVEDTHIATRRIREKYPDLPLILYGHSMGSLIVRAYLKKYDADIDGLFISGCPSYTPAVPFGKLLVKMMKLLKGERYRSSFVNELAVGAFNKPFEAEGRRNAWLSCDSEVSDKFNADKLCQFVYTLNGYQALLNLEWTVYKEKGYSVSNKLLPILFVSGEDDPCYINEKKWNQALERMRSLGYMNVSGILIEGMRHEIHNESEKQVVFEQIDKFCHKCIKNLK
ncbi:MAG: lysophospholipase [Lachnospiraceae bacterium]|nr:lysophospholipase [Lachnospiraceae bacterium]